MVSNSSAKGLGNQFLVLLILGLLCASPWLGGGTFLVWAMLLMLPIVIAFGDLLSVHLVLVFLMPSLVAHLAPQSAAIRAKILPAGVSPRVLPVYMAGFAIINASIEEIIWRGVEMAALEAVFGAGMLALVLQAVQFGLAHYRGGFPNGWSGVGLTFLFGLAMGWLRMRTKGLLVPWIAHAVADFTIICLVVYRVGM